MLRKFFTITILFFVSSKVILATGNTILENILLGVTARSTGMGEAFCSIPGKLDGLYYNPASISTIDYEVMNISYFKSFIDQYYASIDFGYPIPNDKDGAIIAGGITYFNGGTFEANYPDGTSETFSAEQDIVLSIGLGMYPRNGDDEYLFGIVGKVISSKLVDKYSAEAYALDVGSLCKLSKKVYFGIAYQNWGTKIKYSNTEERLPEILRLGISYVTDRLIVACDYNKRYDDDKRNPSKINIGTEYALSKEDSGSFILRCGYNLHDGRQGLSAGFGILWNNNNEGINYAIQDLEGVNFHKVTLIFKLKNDKSVPVEKKTQAAIRIRVIDDKGNFIPEVTLQLFENDTEIEKIITNQNGQYIFNSLIPGKYKIKVWKKGYVTKEITKDINSGKSYKIKLIKSKN